MLVKLAQDYGTFLRFKRPVMYGGVSPLRRICATYSILVWLLCKVCLLNKPWCGVDGEVDHEDLISNKLMTVIYFQLKQTSKLNVPALALGQRWSFRSSVLESLTWSSVLIRNVRVCGVLFAFLVFHDSCHNSNTCRVANEPMIIT